MSRNNSRMLPHNPEAEAAVLAGIMLRNDVIDKILDMLDQSAFYVPAHRYIFSAMKALHGQGQPIDPVTLEDQLRATSELGLVGGLEGIGKLADRFASSHNAIHHAKIVRDKAAVRQLVVTCLEVADMGMGPIENVPAFIDDAERRVLTATEMADTTAGYKTARAVMHQVVKDITEQAKAAKKAREEGRPVPIRGLSTGFTALDALLDGLGKEQLIIIAARPAMGKTSLALNISDAVVDALRQNVPALIFSLEMGHASLVRRELLARSGVKASDIRDGKFMEEEYAGLFQAAGQIIEEKLVVDDRGGASITQIRSVARRWSKDRNFFDEPDPDSADDSKPRGLVVVDYLQIAKGEQGVRYGNREQEVAAIASGLKSLAKELRMPVIALAQLNRGVDSRADHRPKLSDLRESGAIEQDADVIMFIYREAVYIDDEAEKRNRMHEAEVIVAKQREGDVGTVPLIWKGELTKFANPEWRKE